MNTPIANAVAPLKQQAMTTFTFSVVERTVEFVGRQITFDVVRSDGRVVRTGLWHDCAEVERDLLNEFVAKGWTAGQYHAERRARLAALRAALV